jgi:hypothetical protein
MSTPGLIGLLTAKLNFGALWNQLQARKALALRYRKWGITLTVIGGLLGALYGFTHPQLQLARVLIAVEDDDSGGWQLLLEQFGIDIGGNNPGGIFKGEALVQLFSTRSQVERTLLREVTFDDGEKELLINRYLRQSKIAQRPEFKDITFTTDRSLFTPLQDSLLKLIHLEVINGVMSVQKPDTKLSIISLEVKHKDRYFAKRFAEECVRSTADYYVETVSIKAKKNFEVLRREADSVRQLLQGNLVASATLSDININPTRQVLRIGQNQNNVELQINAALYSELIKNLKLAEIGLRKETPLIQLVDSPHFPLDRVGMHWWQHLILGALIAFLGFILVFLLIPTE